MKLEKQIGGAMQKRPVKERSSLMHAFNHGLIAPGVADSAKGPSEIAQHIRHVMRVQQSKRFPSPQIEVQRGKIVELIAKYPCAGHIDVTITGIGFQHAG